jgi:hypothetical protein
MAKFKCDVYFFNRSIIEPNKIKVFLNYNFKGEISFTLENVHSNPYIYTRHIEGETDGSITLNKVKLQIDDITYEKDIIPAINLDFFYNLSIYCEGNIEYNFFSKYVSNKLNYPIIFTYNSNMDRLIGKLRDLIATFAPLITKFNYEDLEICKF